ncbi:MAG: acetyl-CoA carboxylase biotin carboxyl carrier protein [Planctomycetota bacterium]
MDFMELTDKIRRLADLMDETDLAELEVEEPELRVKLKSESAIAPQFVSQSMSESVPATAAGGVGGEEGQKESVPDEKDDNLLEITSPMVGSFYRAPSEGAEPYVTVGSHVEQDTVVCIVEAMKVMNEVKSEVSGEVVEILAQNAEPVEFGQVLFLVEPLED